MNNRSSFLRWVVTIAVLTELTIGTHATNTSTEATYGDSAVKDKQGRRSLFGLSVDTFFEHGPPINTPKHQPLSQSNSQWTPYPTGPAPTPYPTGTNPYIGHPGPYHPQPVQHYPKPTLYPIPGKPVMPQPSAQPVVPTAQPVGMVTTPPTSPPDAAPTSPPVSDPTLNPTSLPTVEGQPTTAPAPSPTDTPGTPTPVPVEPTSVPTEVCVTVADVACTTPGFETLCSLVEEAGLTEVLDDPTATLTVFAPTNEAFEAISSVLPTLSPEDVVDILLYHVFNGVLLRPDLICGNQIGMANGLFTQTQCPAGESIFQQVGTGNAAPNLPEIILFDVEACNGVIHVVDNVILPGEPPSPPPTPQPTSSPSQRPTEATLSPTAASSEPSASPRTCSTITEIACTNPDFFALCGVLQDTGLDEVLNDLTASFTVFAPINSAFVAIGDVLPTLPPETVTNIILYHAVDSVIFSANLLCGNQVEMVNGLFTTTSCSMGGDFFQVGTGNQPPDLPQIIEFDIEACNGVVHAVNNVILPGALTPTEAPSLGCTIPTIADRLCADPNFTVTCEALRSTGLDEVLNDPGNTLTLFAPSNEAWGPLANQFLRLPLNQQEFILLYHVTEGSIPASSLVPGPLDMVNGLNTVIASLGGIRILGTGNALQSSPRLIATDIMACNGLIHTISGVILPRNDQLPPPERPPPTSPPMMLPTPTTPMVPTSAPATMPTTSAPAVAPTTLAPISDCTIPAIEETLCADPNFSITCGFLASTGLDVVLNDPSNVLTLFAPANNAWGALENQFAQLPLDQQTFILLYHVTEGSVLAEDLVTGPLPMVNGLNAVIQQFGAGFTILGGGNNLQNAPAIVSTDVMACNGVIHTISGVILPRNDQLPAPTQPPVGMPTNPPATPMVPTSAPATPMVPTSAPATPMVPTAAPAEIPTPPAPAVAPSTTVAPAGDGTCSEENPTIFGLLCGDPNFSTTCNILELTGLDATLNDPNEDLTLFAPSNGGWNTISASIADLTNEQLEFILLTHVTSGTVLSTDLVQGGLLPMLNGENTQTREIGTGIFQVGEGNTGQILPRIATTNIMACNGVFHTLTQVILPDPATFIMPTAPPVQTTPTTAPATTTAQPVTTTAAPVTTTSPPVTTTAAPVTTTSPPVTTTAAPVTTTAAPVAATPTAAPVTTTAAPVAATPTAAPVTTTAAPVAATPTVAPVTTTAAPVAATPTAAPVLVTQAPVGSELVTVTSSPITLSYRKETSDREATQGDVTGDGALDPGLRSVTTDYIVSFLQNEASLQVVNDVSTADNQQGQVVDPPVVFIEWIVTGTFDSAEVPNTAALDVLLDAAFNMDDGQIDAYRTNFVNTLPTTNFFSDTVLVLQEDGFPLAMTRSLLP